MAREVSVRLSADISAYLQAMGQAEQATAGVADAVDQLQNIRIEADTAQASSDLQNTAGAADSAASSLENTSGAAESAGAGLESAGAGAESAASGLDSASAAGEGAAGGMQAAGAAGEDAASGMQSAGAAGQDAGAGMEAAGAGADAAVAGLANVGAQSQDITAAMSGVSASANDITGKMSSLDRGLLATAENSKSAFRQTGTALAVVGGGMTALMTNVIQTGIEYNTLQQVAGRAMETMTGNASEAAAQMDRLHEFADTSPFARDVWITAQQQLMAFGMEGERVVPTMEGIQNAVAAVGGGSTEIMRLVDILGTVEGQGQMTGVELRRMGQMGINAADLMGAAMGVSGNEIRTQITAGAMDAETAITALAEGMNMTFEGAAQNLRDTLPGAIDRLQARIRDLGSIMATPLVDPEGGGFLVDAINMAADFGSALLDLPDPLLQVAGLGAGAAGAITLIGSGIVLALPQIKALGGAIASTWSAVSTFTRGLPGMVGGIGNLAVGAGIAAAAIAGMAIISHIGGDVEDFTLSVTGAERAMLRLAEGNAQAAGSLVDFERNWSVFGESVDGLDGAMEKLTDPGRLDRFRGWAASFLPLTNDMDAATQATETWDEAMASAFAAGRFDEAAAGFSEVMAAADDLGWSASDVAERFPQMTDAVNQAALAAGVRATDMDVLAIATNAAALEALQAGEDWEVIIDILEQGADASYNAGSAFEELSGSARVVGDAYAEVASQIDEATSSLSGLLDNLTAVGDMNMSAEMSTAALYAATDDLNGVLQDEENRLADLKTALNESEISQKDYDNAVKDTLVSLDLSTQAGRDYVSGIHDIYAGTYEAAEGMAILGASQDELHDHLMSGVDSMIDFRMEAGESREEAEAWVRTMLDIPDDISIETYMDRQAQLIAEETLRTLHEIPTWIEILVGAEDEEAQAVLTALEMADYETVVEVLGDDDLAREVVMAYIAEDWETVIELLGDDEQAWGDIQNLTDAEHLAIIRAEAETTAAIGMLDDASRDRIADILAEAGVSMAEAQLTQTARDRVSEVLADPNTTNAEGQLNETGRDRVAEILADPNSWNAEGELNNTARDRSSSVTATAFTSAAEAALNYLARNRTSTLTVRQATVMAGTRGNSGRPPGYATGGIARAAGGMRSLPGYSTGGRLPYTGLGTDKIMGISASGMPTAMVDDREWIINRRSSDLHSPLLAAINANDIHAIKAHVAGYADGGMVSVPQYRPREFPSTRGQNGTNIDYSRLAQAVGQQKHVHFNFETHNPVAQSNAETAQRAMDMIGGGLDPDDWMSGGPR